jgi:catechol 2,3-dioxygenase-like lactoylglutathione lyase family enzyme
MFNYVTLGSNDLERALPFYDAVLGLLGGKRAFNSDRLHFYADGKGSMLAIGTPWDKNPATHGNGTMLGLTAPDRETVDKVYRTALAHGGTDEGAPGIRGGASYGAYFRDPDGNKLGVFKMGETE